MRHASSSSTTPTWSTPSRCERCCSPPAGCSPAARSSCSSCAGRSGDTLPEGWRKLAAGATGGTLTVGPLGPTHISELGLALGVAMTPDAAGRLWEHTRGSPLYARAVLRELPADDSWQYEPRPLPVPESYAHLVRRDLERCPTDVVTLIEAAAVLGVRSPLQRGRRAGRSRGPARDAGCGGRERVRAAGRPRRRHVRRVLAPPGARRHLRSSAEGAALRAQQRRRGHRRRRGRGDAPSRGGGDHHQRRAARGPRGACARGDVTRCMVERRVEPDRSEPPDPGAR